MLYLYVVVFILYVVCCSLLYVVCIYVVVLSVFVLYLVHTLAWKNGLAEWWRIKTYKSNQINHQSV